MSAALTPRALWCLLGGILLLRLAGLDLYPLMDTSEARYGEIARKMVALDDWVTPMFDHGIPFWGKPPLSFWSQAASMKLFGVGEFAARLPAWLFHAASTLLIVRLGRQEFGLHTGLLAAVIYSSCALGLVSSGVVLTDPALGFAMLLAYFGFWRGMAYRDGTSALLGFAGLGLGLLAKGPLAVPLLAIPAVAWTFRHRQWRALAALPWLSGLGLATLVAIPWYVVAEARSPGFLAYFLVGEHWNRFVVSGWSGDLYGTAHIEPRGTIWLHLAGAFLPWSLLLPLLYFARDRAAQRSRCHGFLWAWALAAPLFFTMAGNILWTYVLPALPAWSLLLADGIARCRRLPPWTLIAGALLLPLMLAMVVLDGSRMLRRQNQREIVSAWDARQQRAPGPLYYIEGRSYSAEFYSAGRARHVASIDELPRGETLYVATREAAPSRAWIAERRCAPVVELNETRLLHCPPLPAAAH